MPVLICTARAPVSRIRSASWLVCWSPSITAIGKRVAELARGAREQRRLAGAGRGDEVERQHAGAGEIVAVVGGDVVVLGEDVASISTIRAAVQPGRMGGAERPVVVVGVIVA